MKKLFVIFLILLCFMCSAFSSVIVHWNSDDTDPYYGGAINSGGYIWWTPDAIRYSGYVHFDRENYDYAPMILGTSFTFEAIYPSGLPLHVPIIGYKGYGSVSDFLLQADSGPDAQTWYVNIGENAFSFETPYYTDAAYHFALVKNEELLSFYLDGNLFAKFLLDENTYVQLGEDLYLPFPDPRVPSRGLRFAWADEIRISNEALRPDQFLCASSVPEPSTMALFGLGAALLARRKRKKNM